jgi:hypothetical protein
MISFYLKKCCYLVASLQALLLFVWFQMWKKVFKAGSHASSSEKLSAKQAKIPSGGGVQDRAS